MSCPQCGSPEGSLARLCPTCIAANNARAKSARDQAHQLVSSKTRALPFEDILQWWKQIFGTLALCGFLLYKGGVFGFGTMEPVALNSINGSGDPCAQKERCLVAFFTPWCPSCQGAVGELQELRASLSTKPNVGLKVVVGSDAIENLRTMASKIKGQVFLDPDGAFASSAGVSGVPAWWVVNNKKKIVARGSGWSSQQIESEL